VEEQPNGERSAITVPIFRRKLNAREPRADTLPQPEERIAPRGARVREPRGRMGR